tara:strand:+ start:1283 stop:2152 length:870 start_codon:yes stop_codon:yes gene_type:complete
VIKVRKVSTDWGNGMPSGLTYFFIGQPKTGKTTACASWSEKGAEGVLVLDTDLGAEFVDNANVVTITSLNAPSRPVLVDNKQVTKGGVPQVEVIPPTERGFVYRSGQDKGKPMPVYSLIEAYQWLDKEWDTLPYDTVVIDTLGQVNEWVEDIVLHELGITAMGEGQWGADWGKARRKNIDIIKRFQNLIKKKGGNLVLVSHSKTTTVTDGKAQLSPELPRGLGYSLAAKADVIGYSTASKDDGGYYISFEAYDERVVGSRLKPLSQKVLKFDYDSIVSEIQNYKEKANE